MAEALRFWIVGAGAHGRVMRSLLVRKGLTVSGFIDPFISQEEGQRLGVPILSDVSTLSPTFDHLVQGIGSVDRASVQLRARVFDELVDKGFLFDPFVDSTALVAAESEIGSGTQVHMGACVQTGVRMGRNTIINTKASIDHDCVVGDHVHIAPGVTLSGDVRVGDRVHIGTGAVVIQGIQIGSGAMIAAGAVVIRDVAENAVIRGVPGVQHD